VQAELEAIRAAGTYKSERVITTPQRASIGVEARGAPVLNFCANNYLGLSDDRRLEAAAKEAVDSRGNGLSSVRFICGTQDIHKELEREVARFHGKEDCILYPSCFDANAGLFEALLTPEDAILSDELNHASIIDGVRLCKAKRFRYRHMDLADLEAKLQEADAAGARVKMVATDGVFSMDGDVAPLDRIAELCTRYGAVLMTDECHSSGFFGATGRGTPEYFGVMDQVDIVNSTFGKALGGASGGFTCGSKAVIDLLRQRSRPYLFSNTMAPAVVAAAREAMRMVDEIPELLQRLQENTKLFRSRMSGAGFELRGVDHPIVPVMLGDARLASQFSEEMLAEGIYVVGFSYPVVPKGLARIRVQLSAAHTTEQVNACVDAFVKIGKKLGAI